MDRKLTVTWAELTVLLEKNQKLLVEEEIVNLTPVKPKSLLLHIGKKGKEE